METTDFKKQATDFLEKFNIKFAAKLTDAKPPPWAEDVNGIYGHHYKITLSKGERGQGVKFGQRVTFDFWSSLRDSQHGIRTVDAYTVLAAVSGDVNCPEDFHEFCGEYGYDEDSRKAERTFKGAAAFGRRLRAFFTQEEITELQEIQ